MLGIVDTYYNPEHPAHLMMTAGTAFGVAIAAAIGSSYEATITVFLGFATVNTAATYMSLRQVTLNSLNQVSM